MYRQTFKTRAAQIADHAHNPRAAHGEGSEFLKGLDETERRCMCVRTRLECEVVADGFIVFRAAHDSSKAMRIWMGEVKKKQ